MKPFGPLPILVASLTIVVGHARGQDRPVLGPSNPALASLDDLMTAFVRKYEVPGAALAVAKSGRLIYARGFGHADVESKEPVRPDSLFRIASISKPITAVAVMRLVGRGALDPEARVFDLLGLEGKVPERATLDPRWRSVTVLQLLRHTGGWDRDVSFDPMFRSVEFARRFGAEPPADQDRIIRAMLGVPFDFDPGARFAYSNFGYCLLGRVIEAVSGRGYEAFVRDEILAPLGIRSMRLGRTFLEHRAPGEVRYYVPGDPSGPSVFAPDVGASVPRPYGTWNHEALDAHGGWIASAIDLVRFASALDDGANPRLLRPEMVHLLFRRPEGAAGYELDGSPRAAYYACGWSVRPVGHRLLNTWHGGSLPGTSTLLVRRHDGYCWAVLFNARSRPGTDALAYAIDPLVHAAADRLPAWTDREFHSAGRGLDPWGDLPELQVRLLDLAFPADPFARGD